MMQQKIAYSFYTKLKAVTYSSIIMLEDIPVYQATITAKPNPLTAYAAVTGTFYNK